VRRTVYDRLGDVIIWPILLGLLGAAISPGGRRRAAS